MKNWISATTKVTTIKQIGFGAAKMNLLAVNLAFGIDGKNEIGELNNILTKQCSKDITIALDLCEKLKLINVENFQQCKGKSEYYPYHTYNTI